MSSALSFNTSPPLLSSNPSGLYNTPSSFLQVQSSARSTSPGAPFSFSASAAGSQIAQTLTCFFAVLIKSESRWTKLFIEAMDEASSYESSTWIREVWKRVGGDHRDMNDHTASPGRRRLGSSGVGIAEWGIDSSRSISVAFIGIVALAFKLWLVERGSTAWHNADPWLLSSVQDLEGFEKPLRRPSLSITFRDALVAMVLLLELGFSDKLLASLGKISSIDLSAAENYEYLKWTQ